MKTEKIIGKGRTSEVYKLEQNKVVKLYLKKFEAWLPYELKITRIVNQAGVLSPKIYDKIKINNRTGIIFQFISGENMLKLLTKKPWKAKVYACKMARIHAKIHEHESTALPPQNKKFENTIKMTESILGEKSKLILDYFHTLPVGNSVCHGDIFAGNIMISNESSQAIDWIAAYSGHPLGDVARACLIFYSPNPIPDEPIFTQICFNIQKKAMLNSYLKEYMMITGTKLQDIEAWMLPITASRIWEKVHGEEKWLIKKIDYYLKKHYLT